MVCSIPLGLHCAFFSPAIDYAESEVPKALICRRRLKECWQLPQSIVVPFPITLTRLKEGFTVDNVSYYERMNVVKAPPLACNRTPCLRHAFQYLIWPSARAKTALTSTH